MSLSLSAGGWCSPSREVYDLNAEHVKALGFPEVKVKRGGVLFPKPGSPEWQRLQEISAVGSQFQRLVNEQIGNMVRAQNYAVGTALFDATRLGMGVRIERPENTREYVRAGFIYEGDYCYMPGPYRFIGIEITPDVPAGYIHEVVHHDPWGDDW